MEGKVKVDIEEYFASMRDACLYGLLVRETFEVQRWLRQKWLEMVHLELLSQRNKLDHEQTLVELQGIEQEFNLERSFVSGLLYQGRDYIQRDPDDPILPYDLANLEDDWNRLGHALISLAAYPRFGLILTKEQYYRCIGNSSSRQPDWNNNNNRNSSRNATWDRSLRQTRTTTTTSSTTTTTTTTTNSSTQTSLSHTQRIFQECTCRCSKGNQFSNLKRYTSWDNLSDLQQHFESEVDSCESEAESDFGSSTSTLKACESLNTSCESFHTACEDSDLDDASSDEELCSRETFQFQCSSKKDSRLTSQEESEISIVKMNAAEALRVGDRDSGRSSPSTQGAIGFATPPRRKQDSLSVSPPTLLGGRSLDSCVGIGISSPEESPALPKRRKMFHHHDDTPSSVSSPRDSPVNLTAFSDFLSLSMDELSSQSFDDSNVSSPTASPATFRRQHDFRKRYKKDELWRAIASDYEYLMDKGIIETCKSTESDLSWESDDLASDTRVSFTEFMQQYSELTDWLNHIHLVTQRQSCSLSEKYLNQTYHEEMLKSSPRRKLFNGYAKQLARRYPNMKEEINARLHYLNSQWEGLLRAISPSHGYQDEQTMLRDLEQDLSGLKKWLHEVESRLLPLYVRPEWSKLELQEKLCEHQALQKDIESHSKIFSAVLKLCDRLQSLGEEGKEGLDKVTSETLEHRWHTVLLQSLEWQCRLEEAIAGGKVRVRKFPSEEDVSEDWSDVSSSKADDSYVDVLGRVQRKLGDFDDCLDSDQSNFDTIPFSENEYEKIQVDNDAQTEPLAERVSPELADVTGRKAERCDSSDQGIDSALGRSLSDRSLDTDNKQGAASVTHATFKLTSDHVNKVVKKVISGEAVEMRATGGTTGSPLAGQPLKLRAESRCESHDVGYGSESHSNDEPDGSVSAKPADAESNALQAVCESQGVSQEDLDAVVRRRNKSPEDMEVNEDLEEDGIAPPFPDPTWRHSMTSAYDTSSNCSDGAACQNDFETSLDTTVETEVHVTTETSDAGLSSSVEVNSDMVIDAHKKVKNLMKSPSQDFYRMTMIETDSEPTSSASKMNPNEECRSGATTDAESELSKSLELPFDDVPVIAEEAIPVVRASGVTNINSELDFPVTNGAFNSNQLRKSDSSLSDTRSETARSLEEVAAKLAVCDNQEYYNNNRLTSSKEELDTPKNNGLLMGSYEIADTDGLLATPNVTNDVVQSLFHQAEAMIREGELPCYQPQRFPEEELKRNKRKSKRKLEKAGGSLPESDASGFRHEDSSSCDASSEGARSTCDSDSDASDLSSSFSDEDNLHHSAILANGCQSTSSTGDATLCGSRSLSCSPHKEGLIPFRRKSAGKTHGDRPRSITALYELTSGLDLSQFTTSISEGAIDNLKRLRELKQASEVGHKLRRTSSDTLKPYETTPHKHRRRRSKRAGSDDSGKLCSSPKPLHSTPLPLRSKTSDPHWSASQSTQDEEPRERKPHSRRSLEREVARRDASGSEPAALLPLPVRCVDSDTDHQPSSMNSTMDPADQEQAWDPFQLAPYSSVSDDPTEEKQDASHLQGEWEHGLEFEDDFQLGSFGQRPDRSKLASRTSPHGSFLEASTRTLDDSDSDLEDFEHCIEESKKAIHFTENTLKNAKDPMGTRIFLDPSEYNDPLATCHTNIKCLQVIIETLESEKGLTTVTDEHIQNVYDLIEQWRDLEGLARERKEQSQALTDMYEDIVKVNKSLREVEDDLANDSFNDISDLVKMINVLQKKHMALSQSQGPQLLKLSSQVGTFSRKNPEVNMQKFAEQVSLLQQSHTDIVDRSRARLADLQPQLLSWYDYSETQRESAYLLQCQEEQLRCVDLAHGVVDFSDDDLRDTIEDLRANKQDFDLLEAKFRSLQSLAGELSDVTSSQAQSEMKARTLQLDMDLGARRRHRQDILDAMEKKLESRRQDEAAAVSEEDAAAAEAAAARRKLGSDEAEPQTKAGKDEVDSCSAKKPSRFLRFMRWLRRSMPMQAVLVLMFAVLNILHPNSGDSLAAYCIRLTPELRHLQGPPPM